MGLSVLFRRKAENLVGVDIGSSAVKIAQVKQKRRNSYQLEALGLQPLPEGTIVDGLIVSKDPVVDAIQRIFESQNIQQDQVATAISGQSVIVKRVTLPVESEKEIGESIQWEVEQYIPFDTSQVNLDYHTLGPTSEGNQTEVILVAARRDKIEDQTGVISMAGKTPMVVDVDAFAIQNVYEVNYQPEPETVVALLNIGASVLNVGIVRGTEFVFTRDIGIGGYQYTEALRKELGFSYEEAEKYKRGEVLLDELKETAGTIVQSVSEILALEVQKTFDYFRSTTRYEDIQRIYISGGASQTEGLRAYLEETFQLPVEFLDPFKHIRADESALASVLFNERATDFAVAIGLALRAPKDR